MKPAAPSKPTGRSPSPPSASSPRRAPFLIRGALVLFLAVTGLTTLALVIIAFRAAVPAAGVPAVEAGPSAAPVDSGSLPTLALVVPTPVIANLPVPAGIEDMATATAVIAEAVPATTLPSPTPEPPTVVPTLEPPNRVPINGIPYESIIVLPDEVIARSREIFLAGRAIGRNPRAYAKVGDSTTENPHFMARFDTGPYNLGDYAYLQPAVDHFLGSHSRDSLAVHIGLHSWTANDPAWAEPGVCLPNETPVQCEIRAHNPAVLLIRLGTNDVGVGGMFEANIRQIVETAIAGGVIPVIGTKGDRHEGSNENNDILRRVAADYRIPLWDYDRVADTLPARGLDVDFAHMNTFYAHDYTDPTAFTRGHAMHNLTALMMLDAVWRLIMKE